MAPVDGFPTSSVPRLVLGLAAVAVAAILWAGVPGTPRAGSAVVGGGLVATALVATSILVRSTRAMSRELHDRNRQLDCLLLLSRLARSPGVTPVEVYRGAVDLVLRAFRHPALVGARLRVGAREWVTDGFDAGTTKLEATIVAGGDAAGKLSVHFADMKARDGADPFSWGERVLLEAIADRLGRVVETEEPGHRASRRQEAADEVGLPTPPRPVCGEPSV